MPSRTSLARDCPPRIESRLPSVRSLGRTHTLLKPTWASCENRGMAQPNAIAAEAALERDVDPVARASEYQQLMLGVLGDRDPVQVLAELPDEAEGGLAQAGGGA